MKISCILTVYNGEKYICQAVESILSQDYPDYELIVIDDGSTDQTKKALLKYQQKIRYLFQKNRGLGASRNAGVRASKGEYIAFLDHDDLWTEQKLSKQAETLVKDREDPLLFGHVQQFICPSLSEEEKRKVYVDTKKQPAYFAGTLMLSRKRLEEIGPFLEEKVLGEFVEWYLRAIEQKIPIQMHPELLLKRRVHQDNMGRQKDLYDRSSYLKILRQSLQRRRDLTKSFP